MAHDDALQYFWDDVTRQFYYFDETTEAYCPCKTIDTFQDTMTNQTHQPSVTQLDIAKPPTPNCEAESLVDPTTPAVDKQKNMSDVQTSQSYAQKSRSQRGSLDSGVRNERRRYTFSQHGGLAGCIQLANAERLMRTEISKLSDESIKLEHQKQRVRDIIKECGIEQQGVDSTYDNKYATTASKPSPSNQQEQHNEKNVTVTLPLIPSSFVDTRSKTIPTTIDGSRNVGGRSSIRFCTVHSKDTNVQKSLQSLLKSQIRQ